MSTRIRTRHRWTAAVLALVGSAAAAGCGTGSAAPDGTAGDPALVTTGQGQVQGMVVDDYVAFRGIPYAAPPVGELRWAAPEPVPAWQGVRDASESGPACAQFPGNQVGIPSDEEDCLYLDVYAPVRPAAEALPVMVWIHGGGNNFGAGSMYNGGPMAVAGEVVVVTVNYRQGALASLVHPALDGADGEVLSGNYGLQDQQAALTWVQEEATAFGGDPDNVTLFGESGGAFNVCAHLASPSAAGLFHRAIIQSGPCSSAWAPSWEEGLARGTALADQLGCAGEDAASCLREAEVTALLAASAEIYAMDGFPAVGGPLLPITTADALATGDFHRVPVMHGITHDEWQLMIGGQEVLSGETVTEQGYPTAVAQWFGDDAEQVLDEYPVTAYDHPAKALAAALTDQQYALPAHQTNQLFGEHVPTFGYDLAERGTPWFTGREAPSWPTDSYHMVDVAFLFEVGFIDELDDAQRQLSDAMIAYWSRFAHDGDPNHNGAPPWQPFSSTDPYVQSLASGEGGIGRTDFAADHHYEFWDSLAG